MNKVYCSTGCFHGGTWPVASTVRVVFENKASSKGTSVCRSYSEQ